MASETNELTFVRCPTCRSLVPASAARCRICNAALAAESSNDSSGEPEKPSRERHRTVSARPDEIEKMTSGIANRRDDHSPKGATNTQRSDDTFDPLGAFLDELDAEEPVLNEESEADINFDDTIDGESDFDDMIGDLEDDLDFEQVSSDAKEATNSKVDNEQEPKAYDRSSTQTSEQATKIPDRRETKPTNIPRRDDKQVFRKAEGENKRFDREHKKLAPRGAKPRFGSKSRKGENSNRGATDDRVGKQQATNAPNVATDRRSPSFTQPRGVTHEVEDRAAIVHGEAKRSPERVESTRQLSSSAKRDPDAKATVPPNEQAHRGQIAEDQKRAKVRTGRLFGWLISYENRDGRAIELRSGRFFITGTSIRDSDLILEDQSMSTPHALVSITERGLLIQDLMSERGTFVRSEGDAQYRREEAVIEVKHGDWIRFGDVEFLVALVPE